MIQLLESYPPMLHEHAPKIRWTKNEEMLLISVRKMYPYMAWSKFPIEYNKYIPDASRHRSAASLANKFKALKRVGGLFRPVATPEFYAAAIWAEGYNTWLDVPDFTALTTPDFFSCTTPGLLDTPW